MINVALLKEVLAFIEANPDEWYQADCRCGSGMCFAGWACQLAGGRWYRDSPEESLADALIAEPDEPHSFKADDGVRLIYADHRAARVLGITVAQADWLFAGGNKLPDLRHIVAELCREAA